MICTSSFLFSFRHAVSFDLPQCCCSPFSLYPLVLTFITFFTSLCFPKIITYKKNSLVSILLLKTFSNHLLTPFPTIAFSNCIGPVFVIYFCLFFLHFLVLTSLSIRALRVLWTSSPSLSISAFKRSFCSVSSCTFRSFSCSLSLRLFLVDE